MVKGVGVVQPLKGLTCRLKTTGLKQNVHMVIFFLNLAEDSL